MDTQSPVITREKEGLFQTNRENSHRFLCLSLLLLVGIQPFLYAPNIVDAASLPRYLAIQIVVTLLVGIALLQNRNTYISIPTHPKTALVFLSVFIFTSMISLFWAQDKGTALIDLAKMLGSVQLFALCWILARDQTFLLAFAWVATLTAGLVSLGGFYQSLGYDLLFYIENAGPAATFINKNICAQYLLTVLPLSCMIFLLEKKKSAQLLLTLVLALITFMLIITKTRGAWLAVLSTAVATLFLLLASRTVVHAAMKHLSMVKIGFVLIFAMFTSLLLNTQKQPHQETFSRLNNEWESLAQPRKNTAKLRIALNMNAIQMLLDRPLAGRGIGNLRASYPLYHNAVTETPRISIRKIPHRLHNDFLQNFVELGLIGGGAFLLFLAAIFAAPVLGMASRDYIPRLCLFASVFALAIHALFSFPLRMPTSSMMFWMCCGLICGSIPSPTSASLKLPNVAWLMIIGMINMLNLCLIGFFTFWFLSNADLKKSYDHVALKQGLKAYGHAQKAVSLFSWDWRNLDQLVSLSIKHSNEPGQAEKDILKYLSREPHNPNTHYRYAFLLHKLNRKDEALNEIERSIELGGEDHIGYYLKGLIQMDLGKPIPAASSFRHTLEINPQYWPAMNALRHIQLGE